MSASLRMEGKRTLVTGSGTGLGREIALEFARQGADVVMHYSHESDGAFTASEEIRAMGRRCKVFQADFNDIERELRTTAAEQLRDREATWGFARRHPAIAPASGPAVLLPGHWHKKVSRCARNLQPVHLQGR